MQSRIATDLQVCPGRVQARPGLVTTHRALEGRAGVTRARFTAEWTASSGRADRSRVMCRLRNRIWTLAARGIMSESGTRQSLVMLIARSSARRATSTWAEDTRLGRVETAWHLSEHALTSAVAVGSAVIADAAHASLTSTRAWVLPARAGRTPRRRGLMANWRNCSAARHVAAAVPTSAQLRRKLSRPKRSCPRDYCGTVPIGGAHDPPLEVGWAHAQ